MSFLSRPAFALPVPESFFITRLITVSLRTLQLQKKEKQVQSKQCAKVICLQTSSWKGGFSGIFISSRLYLLAYRAVGQLVEPASGLLDVAASGREPRREQESL